MSALTSARTDLADALRLALSGSPDGVQVFATIPEKVTPPFIAIGPGDPYIELEGAVFNGHRVRLHVTCVVAPGTNDLRADALDDLILDVLNAIDELSPTWATEQVQQPGQLAVNGQAHLGATISVLTEV